MKFFLILLATLVLSVSYCQKTDDDLKQDVLQNVDTFEDKVTRGKADDGIIIAVINDYADLLFRNINAFAIKRGLDPMALPDVKEGFLGAEIILRNGTLNGISTIQRTDDARIGYSSQKKKFGVHFPIDLNDLYFLYHFSVKILILEVKGHLKGEIKDFRANVKFSFDFNKYNAFLEDVSTQGMGPITLTFDDHNIVADIINLLSKFVAGILHPLIEGIIHGTMVTVGKDVVTVINKELDKFLHPNGTLFLN